MVQQVTTLNLRGYNFPLLSSGIGSSAALNGKLDLTEHKPKPQLVYCENLLPTKEGYRSVTYKDIAPAANNPVSADFGEVYNVASSDGKLGWFAQAGGTNQLWQGTAWKGTGVFGAGLKTSHANITGQSYICYAFNTIKRVNLTAETLTANTDPGDTIVGITVAEIKGIVASGNYLIAYGEDKVSWSSPADPMDFTPSLVTGAGTATPSDLKGQIVECVQITNGFIIYTTKNAVSAIASGNTEYPWIFRHIAGSTGLRPTEDAVTDDIADSNIAWTVDGFKEISVKGTVPILPEIADFVAAHLMETYDAGTGLLTVTELAADLILQVHRTTGRYLIISYGITTMTHALIFDTALKRWGKLVVPNVEVASLPASHADAHNAICFIAPDGAVKQLLNNATATDAEGVAIFGRFTVTDTSVVTLQEVIVESPKPADIMELGVGVSYKGGLTQEALVKPAAVLDGTVRNYPMRLTGAAHYLHFNGMLNLTSLVVKSTQAGVR